MEIELQETAAGEKEVVIRLLNGMLHGCEFEIGTGKTLFVVGNETTLLQQNNLPTFPENTIFIPSITEGYNFSIEVTASDSADATPNVLLYQYHAAAESCLSVIFNQHIMVGDVAFVVKALNMPWMPAALIYPAPVEPDALKAGLSSSSTKSPKKSLALQWGGGISLIAVVLSVLVFFKVVSYWNDPQRELVNLSSLLADSSGKYQILHGSDNWIYVLAATTAEATWMRQSVLRIKTAQPIRVRTLQEEETRIALWLTKNWPEINYHRIRMDDPTSPVLMLSKERTALSAANKAKLLNSVRQQLPYAKEINWLAISDHQIVQQAEAGIKKIAIPYTRNDNGNSVTFIMSGALDDGQIQQIRTFATHYHHLWGEQYVQFALELKDDWLKGKSFKYGHQGYVKVAPGYWYFPKPI